MLGRRRGSPWLVVVIVVGALAACRGEKAPSGPRVAVAGTTEQGLRIRLDPEHGDVAVRISLRCGPQKGVSQPAWSSTMPLHGTVTSDGSFEVVGKTTDEEAVARVTLRGRFVQAARAAGTADVTLRTVEGRCEADDIRWKADERIPPSEPVEALREEVSLLLPDDDIVWAATASNGTPRDVVRLDVAGVDPGVRTYDIRGADSLFTYIGSFSPDGSGGFWLPVHGRDPVDVSGRHVSPDGNAHDLRQRSGVRDLTLTSSGLWLLEFRRGTHPLVMDVEQVDATGAVRTSVPVANAKRLAGDARTLWALSPDRLVRIDAATATVTHETPVRRFAASSPFVANDAGGWVVERGSVVTRVDADGEVTRTTLPSAVDGLALDGRGVWASSATEQAARRVEAGRVTRTVDIVGLTGPIAVDSQGRLWAATRSGVRIVDPRDTRRHAGSRAAEGALRK